MFIETRLAGQNNAHTLPAESFVLHLRSSFYTDVAHTSYGVRLEQNGPCCTETTSIIQRHQHPSAPTCTVCAYAAYCSCPSPCTLSPVPVCTHFPVLCPQRACEREGKNSKRLRRSSRPQLSHEGRSALDCPPFGPASSHLPGGAPGRAGRIHWHPDGHLHRNRVG